MAETPDILIIGGGVIGLTAAYYLARDGARVAVVDKGDFGQEASWAGAGILPPGNSTRARTAIDKLRGLSAEMFPGLSAELREATGIDNGYLRSGGLELVDAKDESSAHLWRREGIEFEYLEGATLREREPLLRPGIEKAYCLPALAQVRNPRHLKALLAGCADRGVTLKPGSPVHRFETRGGRVVAGVTATGAIAAERFLLTAGAWTDPLLQPFGWKPGIRPVRGQIVLLETGESRLGPVLLQGKCYLVPRPDGRVLVGSTEEDVGFDKRTTAAAVRDLLAFACGLVPRLAAARVERAWAGLRPGSPDGLPFIGPVPGVDNLFVAAGHFRAGIQLSPATGLAIKELLLGQPLSVALEPFRLDREPGAPYQPAFRS